MSGKTVLITGAGSGIGAALAIEADHLGHSTILVGRRFEALQATATRLRQPHRIIAADLTTPEGRARITDTVTGTGLDILVNNAGMVVAGPAGEITDDQIAAALALNVAAPLALTRALLPALIRRKGQVVNMGSVFGDIGFPFFTLYSTTKFALRGFSEALRRELAPQSVAVTYIAPRAARTEAAQNFHKLIGPMAMALDTPEAVARHAWRAITDRKREQFPPTRERLFVAVQRRWPGLIDKSLIRLARDPAVIAAAKDTRS
ncbi:SDR family NAD(P)-dependent oxidoreductase [Paracoccus zhejiangensis]|uniref:Short-chain dehydrogenase n=1 Tax=Paracoccus zhejiangensis TaxID=1077935 RepID=A0A2H5EUA5_9RHOB|nr:SDR family NAD(P)-dependent oxidoreductase [Paracoccus zhejiangensis]AUH62868.1 short-chain dehydrogenase [Paracoccus zhejiangensis]